MKTSTAGKMVVGTDTSERANHAVEWAADRAVARGLELLVVHVVPERPLAGAGAGAPPELTARYEHEYFAESQAQLDETVARLKNRYPTLVVSGEQVKGHSSNVLAQASKDAELVVLGSRGESAPLRVKLLGGVSDAVASHAYGPVAIISDEAHENPGGPVVVGVDESAEAAAAIAMAFDAAELRGVPLVAVHAWDIGRGNTAWEAAGWNEDADALQLQLAEMAKGLLADQQRAHPDVRVDLRVIRARPHEALLKAAKDAGLLIVGSRGRGGFAGLLLGSTSKRVLRDASCPVIVVRGREASNG